MITIILSSVILVLAYLLVTLFFSKKRLIETTLLYIKENETDSIRLNSFARSIYLANKAKGFYDKPNETGTALMLVVGELSEAFAAHREGKHFDKSNYAGFDNELFESLVKDTFEDEVADVVISIFSLAYSHGVDLDFHVLEKLKYNQTRPFLHGKKNI